MDVAVRFVFFFFFNDTATTEIYTLSLHDALPIFRPGDGKTLLAQVLTLVGMRPRVPMRDRKSTRLNSSHSQISYAVFCLKKKKTHRGHRHALAKSVSPDALMAALSGRLPVCCLGR